MKLLVISFFLFASALAVPKAHYPKGFFNYNPKFKAAKAAQKLPVKAYNNGIGGRIIGGTDAERGEFPWIISYQFSFGDEGFHSCGGSILNANKIVTAAHCCDGIGIEDTRIVVGDHNVEVDEGQEQFMQIESLKIHENYDPNTIDYDICVLTLTQVIEMNEYAAPVTISTQTEWTEGTTFTVSGWGLKHEDDFDTAEILQKVNVPYVTDETCSNDYDGENVVTDRMICAGEKGKDSCQGDSGGPMIDSEKNLVGIVSWGIGCAEEGYPGVYSRVASLVDFINDNA